MRDMENTTLREALKSLPAVGEAIHHPALAEALAKHPREVVVNALREEVELRRARLLAGEETPVDLDDFHRCVVVRVASAAAPRLKRVINATGVVVHTNLGRSPLAEEAIAAVTLAARGYSNLEYNLDAGQRGSRYTLMEDLLRELTGAEAALVVNNNAGAVLLALSALAKDREVVISRGELIEIGGSFRIPEVLQQSGARLVEVGATNRTHLADYRRAINEQTAVLMKVHLSNFHMTGFTHSVAGAQLATLAHDHGLLAIEDLGSGSFLPTTELGLPPEPTAREALAAGLDLVTFSGDKLLGGPQAGVLIGRRDLLAACAAHPLHRALRVDKMTLAALEATLRLYRNPAEAVRHIPTLRMIAAAPAQLKRRAERLARLFRQKAGHAAHFTIIQAVGQVGGGALPFAELPGPAIAVEPLALGVEELTRRLRQRPVPIIVRRERDRVIVDPRSVLKMDEGELVKGLTQTLEEGALK